ncbi:unnamed protein product [Rotaria socialis]
MCSFSSLFHFSLISLVYLFFNLFNYVHIHTKFIHASLILLFKFKRSEIDLIHRHLNDIDHRVDDFNYRLKVLENLSVSKQHQYQPTEDSYKKSIHCDDGLRF